MIRKLVFILMLFPLLVPNMSPTSNAVARISSKISIQSDVIITKTSRVERNPEPSLWTFFTEAIGEEEAEEKIISTQIYRSPYIASNYGYALKDHFAILTEEFALPDEPPNL